MKCTNYGAEINDSAKFCPECGTKINKKIFCQNCGTELSSTAKFCPECGTPVQAQDNSQGAEYKLNGSTGHTITYNICNEVERESEEQLPESAQAALQDSKYADSFSDEGFWDKIKGVAGKAGKKVIKEALLLWYVLKSPDVPWTQKSAIIGALGYFVAPLDLIPDFIPVAGFTDDAAALVAVHEMVQASITPEIEEQAENKIRELFD